MHAFIGRQSELERMRTAYARAQAGFAQIALISGEAGIGKTALIAALRDGLRVEGESVFVVSCTGEPGAPACWPWIELLRAIAHTLDDVGLQEIFGEEAACIAQAWPEVSDRLRAARAQAPSDPAQTRFRLFDAVAVVLRRVSRRNALVLVMEDLHGADADTLALLISAAGALTGTSLLFVLTHRSDFPHAQRCTELQLALQRRAPVELIQLDGLASADSARLFAAAAGSIVPAATAAWVQERTEGHPLLVRELAGWMAREGWFDTRGADGQWDIPPGLRALVAARWARLSAPALAILQHAGLTGIAFDARFIGRALAVDPAALYDALDAAHSLGLIHDRGGSEYRFARGLIRDALCADMPAIERARAHERIALAVEREHRHQLERQAPLLAYHFLAALPAGDVTRAIGYALQAASQARRRLAYQEEVRWLEQARDAAVQPSEQHCEIAIALGSACTRAGEMPRALLVLNEAASEASWLGAQRKLAEAAMDFEEAAWRLSMFNAQAAALLELALAKLPQEEGALRVRMRAALVRAYAFSGLHREAASLSCEVIADARQMTDARTLHAALRSRFWLPRERSELEPSLAAAHEAVALAQHEGGEPLLDALAFRLNLLATAGELREAGSDLDRFTALAEELQQPFHRYHALSMGATRALAAGLLDDAQALAEGALRIGRGLPGLQPEGAFGMQMFGIARERGALPGLSASLDAVVEDPRAGQFWRPALAVMLAETGQHARAQSVLHELAASGFHGIAQDSLRTAALGWLAETCMLTGSASCAQALFDLLSPWSGRMIVAGAMVVSLGPADRHLALLAGLLQRPAEARRYFEAASEQTAQPGAELWRVQVQSDHARMLLDGRAGIDLRRASALLDDAAGTAGRLRLTRLSQTIERLREQAGSPPSVPGYPAGLSHREAQVLRLVAAGRSNAEIAHALSRSQHTVANHVRNILAKLGTANRAEAAAFAARHGLL